jgi:hypothetical protein
MKKYFIKILSFFRRWKTKGKRLDWSSIEEQCETFKLTASCSLIEKTGNQDNKKIKCLKIEEQQLLKKEIFTVFTGFVSFLNSEFEDLTEDDILFCCLTVTGIRKNIIAACMGNVNMQAITQRKFRIKKKMSGTRKSKGVFNRIFNNSV